MPSFSTQIRPRSTPSATTATQTQTTSAPDPSSVLPTVTLRLRAEPAESRRIRWAEDVVDNEGLGRKKSKVCCIYHAPRAVGESSSDDDSSSDSDSSDTGGDDAKARMGGKGQGKAHKHDAGDHGCCNHEKEEEGKRKGKSGKGWNAYETVPKRGGSITVTEQSKA